MRFLNIRTLLRLRPLIIRQAVVEAFDNTIFAWKSFVAKNVLTKFMSFKSSCGFLYTGNSRMLATWYCT